MSQLYERRTNVGSATTPGTSTGAHETVPHTTSPPSPFAAPQRCGAISRLTQPATQMRPARTAAGVLAWTGAVLYLHADAMSRILAFYTIVPSRSWPFSCTSPLLSLSTLDSSYSNSHFPLIFFFFCRCCSTMSRVIIKPQCNSVCRMTGEMLGSFHASAAPPAEATRILLQSWVRNRPAGPATPSHLAICRASSEQRRPW
jgi:hypothetical protein